MANANIPGRQRIMDGNSQVRSVFHNLPVEILLEIMRQSTDLSSLWSLLNASVAFTSAFHEAASAIVGEIVSSTVPYQIQPLMQAVLQLQTSSFPYKDVSDIEHLFEEITTPQPLDLPTAPGLLRRFISLAHNIHVLAHECLNWHIKNSLSMMPSRLPGEFHYGDSMPGEHPWHKRPQGERYHPRYTGPPSYMEEHRMINTLWRIQLLYEMRQAQRKSDFQWLGGDDGLFRAAFYNPVSVQAQQISSVMDYVEQRGLKNPASDRFKMPVNATPSTVHLPCSPAPPLKRQNEKKKKIVERLHPPQMGYLFFRNLATDYRSPLRYISFTPYRKYGFAFWDNERMVDLGFLPAPDEKHRFLSTELYFTWRSVLTQEEDELVWREQQALAQ